MTEWISLTAFDASPGVGHWRILGMHVAAMFRTSSMSQAIEVAHAIDDLREAADPLIDIDLRAEGVTVRIIADEANGFSRRHADLAAQISSVASSLGTVADPDAVQEVQLTIDAMDIPAVRAFWRAVLGYRDRIDDVDVLDPLRIGPSVWFQQMDAPRPQRNRIHVDLFVPHDQAAARIEAAIAAGGRLVSEVNAPSGWVLADPEGNEVCVATWMGRD